MNIIDDVAAVLKKLRVAGGGQIREQIVTDYPNNVVATIVYATDPEGNIVELQNWGVPDNRLGVVIFDDCILCRSWVQHNVNPED